MGIPMRAGQDFADLRRYGGAATGDRQRGVRAAVCRTARADWTPHSDARQHVHDRRRRARFASANRSASRLRRSSTCRIAIVRRSRGEIHLRTRAGAETLLAPEVQRIVRDLDPTLPVYDVRTLSDHIEKNLFLRRIPARMFVVLGPLLLVLAAIGIYAVVRTRYRGGRRRSASASRLARPRSGSLGRSSPKACLSWRVEHWPAG